MIKEELYQEYEKILSGKKKNFSGSLFKSSEEENKERAIEVMRYAFGTFLKWTPEDVSHSVNMEIIKIMKLHGLIKHLQIPEEFNSRIDPVYFAHLLYPNKIYYNEAGLVVDIFEKVNSKEMYGYPKKFFHNENGSVRAKICLSHVMRNKLQFSDLHEVYSFFASSEGQKVFSKYHLMSALELFETPIDYVYQSLPASQQDEFLFNYYKFKYLYRKEK